jgi:hypothetical protein
MMADQLPKKQVVAFKVESELAEFLGKLPNKSAFIRKAIVAQLGMACPLCQGAGVVLPGLHDHYAPVLARNNVRPCDGCGTPVRLPRDPAVLDDRERPRVEQFFHGGPLYCQGCYTKAAPCDDCGWHIALERLVEHLRSHDPGRRRPDGLPRRRKQ